MQIKRVLLVLCLIFAVAIEYTDAKSKKKSCKAKKGLVVKQDKSADNAPAIDKIPAADKASDKASDNKQDKVKAPAKKTGKTKAVKKAKKTMAVKKTKKTKTAKNLKANKKGPKVAKKNNKETSPAPVPAPPVTKDEKTGL